MLFLLMFLAFLNRRLGVCLLVLTFLSLLSHSPVEAEEVYFANAELSVLRVQILQSGRQWYPEMNPRLRMDPGDRASRLLPLSSRQASSFPADFERRDFPDPILRHLDWGDSGQFTGGIREQGDFGDSRLQALTAALESSFLLSVSAAKPTDFNLSEQQFSDLLQSRGRESSPDRMAVLCELASREALYEEHAWPVSRQSTRSFRFEEAELICRSPNPAALRYALESRGPLLTEMRVFPSFEAYGGGVYQELSGETPLGVQAVLLIGYDLDESSWIVRNSWGEEWGEEGNCRISWKSRSGIGTLARSFSSLPGEGPHAFMRLELGVQSSREPLFWEDASISPGSRIVRIDWDFDGDGRWDAGGPGPHEVFFREEGFFSPRLRVRDRAGRIDEQVLRDAIEVRYEGPSWFVDSERGSPYGSGSAKDPLQRIDDALARAFPGDSILLRPGIYRGIHNVDLQPGDVLLRGSGELGEVILDGEGRSRLLHLKEGQKLTLENLVLRRGFADRGGAILCEEGTILEARSCIFENCEAEEGGAIFSAAFSLLSEVSFLQNRAGSGGALFRSGGDLRILSGHFEENQASSPDAKGGGAIHSSEDGLLSVDNSLFLYNQSQAIGGAISHESGEARLRFLTSFGNSSLSEGASLAFIGGEAEVMNSIFWQDHSPEGTAVLPNAGTRLHHCLLEGDFPGEGNLAGDPLFEAPEAGDFHLRESSPCLSAAMLQEDLSRDAEGFPRFRPEGSSPDLGAFESAFSASPREIRDEEVLARVQIAGNVPNPFNPTTRIFFELEEAAELNLTVFSTSGQEVARLLEESLPAGMHELSWTAIGEEGEPLASGVYLLRLECLFPDGRVEMALHKMSLIK